MESVVDGPYAVEIGELGWLVDGTHYVHHDEFSYPAVDLSPPAPGTYPLVGNRATAVDPTSYRDLVYTAEHPTEWPDGWVELGYTDEGFTLSDATGEHLARPQTSVEQLGAAVAALREAYNQALRPLADVVARAMRVFRQEPLRTIIIDEIDPARWPMRQPRMIERREIEARWPQQSAEEVFAAAAEQLGARAARTPAIIADFAERYAACDDDAIIANLRQHGIEVNR